LVLLGVLFYLVNSIYHMRTNFSFKMCERYYTLPA
jgi:hypothetical protein